MRDALLDLCNGLLRLLLAAVRHEPARTLRNAAPQEDDDDSEQGPQEEAEAPSPAVGEDVRVEEEQVRRRSERSARPVRAVDGDVDATAVVRGDQFVDRRVDCRVLAPDAGTGDESEDEEEPGSALGAEARDQGAAQVDQQGDEEQLPASQPVREPAEHERAGDLPDQVDRARPADGRCIHVQGVGVAVLRDDLRLEAVEDPRHPEADDDQGVEAGPRQAVQPRRHEALDGADGVLSSAGHAPKLRPGRLSLRAETIGSQAGFRSRRARSG